MLTLTKCGNCFALSFSALNKEVVFIMILTCIIINFVLPLIMILTCVIIIQILYKLLAMMSRPMVLVFLLLILIITSQFDWKQQLVNDMDSSPSISQKQQQISKREEVVKEKVSL